MLDKITSYLGFAKKKNSLFVGVKLDEMIMKKKIKLIVIFSDCNEKNKAKMLAVCEKNQIDYIFLESSEKILKLLGYSALNYLGITDINLSEAIKKVSEE